MSKCPTCGDVFDSKGGMRYHHARVHDESIAGDEAQCDNCGDIFRRNPAKINNNGNVYCGRSCQNEHAKHTIKKPLLYEMYWGEKKPTSVMSSELGVSKQTVRRRLGGHGIPMLGNSTNHDAWLFSMKSDEWLRGEYHDERKSTYQIAHENGVYQDWVRLELHRRGIETRDPGFVGHERGEWPAPKYDYGPGWAEQRLSALKRDRFTCQGCGSREDDLDASLHVHHVRQFPSFDDPQRANRLENLVALCPQCHRDWEGMPVAPCVVR